MTTLHMQTEDVLEMARQVRLFMEEYRGKVSDLNASSQGMDWIGISADEFRSEIQYVMQLLEKQIDVATTLAERVEREVTTWEECSATLNGTMPSIAVISGGGYLSAGLLLMLPPIFSRLLPGPPAAGWTTWLSKLYQQLFHQEDLPGPVEETKNSPGTTTALGTLHEQDPNSGVASQTSQPAAPAKLHGEYETYFDVTPEYQGNAYGRAACLPTSLSMITNYYHAKDPANRAVSPDDLVGMLDPGDGTKGKGVGFDRLTDDLHEVGYTHVETFQSNMSGLGNELKQGPVVVNVKADLFSLPERSIKEGNGYNHAMVVKGLSSDHVLVNDPWTGKEINLPRDEFERMWKSGDQWLQTIRP